MVFKKNLVFIFDFLYTIFGDMKMLNILYKTPFKECFSKEELSNVYFLCLLTTTQILIKRDCLEKELKALINEMITFRDSVSDDDMKSEIMSNASKTKCVGVSNLLVEQLTDQLEGAFKFPDERSVCEEL